MTKRNYFAYSSNRAITICHCMGHIRERLLQIYESKKEVGLTQAELARRMKCVPSQINHLLSGERKLNEDWIVKFCNAMDIPLSDLEWRPSPKIAKDEVHRKLQEMLKQILESGTEWAALISGNVISLHHSCTGEPPDLSLVVNGEAIQPPRLSIPPPRIRHTTKK